MPLSDMALIYERREKALGSGQEQAKLEWAKLVVRYVERVHSDATNLTDATLIRYVDEAMAVVSVPPSDSWITISTDETLLTFHFKTV